jgi:N-acetylglucosamine kinase-like BadF-type ATPase
MTIVLAVDGGGSKTHLAICDETGAVLGAATAGPSNWETVGLRGAADTIGDAIEKALAASGVRRDQIESAAFGLAGVDWPSDVDRLTTALAALRLSCPTTIVNDSYIALRAGARAPWGVAVIAGTGTVVAGRNRAGETFRTLGLGRLLGDEGSASDVAEQVIRAVARAYIGRSPATSLSEALRQLMGADSVEGMLEEYSRGGEPELNAAPLALEHAARGDTVAVGIIEWAAAELGGAASTVARRLGMEREPYELVLSGGLFRGGGELLETLISRAVPTALLTRLEVPPVSGAVLMALELIGGRPTPDIHERCSRALTVSFRTG